MENNNIICGDVYLKRGPEIFNPDSSLDDQINELEFETSKENPDFGLFDHLERFKLIRDIAGQLDYSGTHSFWKVFTDGETFEMVNCEVPYLKRSYSSLNELNKNFIRLSDFLKIAKFVGREFKRNKPIKDYAGLDDNSFRQTKDNRTKYIVLYATKELFLIKRIDNLSDEYALINSRYTLDGNYEFFGPVYEEYRDTKKVYSEIFNQVSEQMKKNKGR